MPGFDVLDPELNVFENRFLEASAGTGKTFAIENLVIRLLESGIPLNEILVVTFTRAATVELKERIRRHLTREQLVQFDESRIWTIHSFCFHCLQEHALQTGFTFDPLEESASPALFKQIVKDYLRVANVLSPKQLAKVLNDSLVDQIVSLVNRRLPIEQPDWNFELPKIDPEKLLEDLVALAPQYNGLCDRQKNVKLEVVEGLKRFTSLIAGEKVDPVDLPIVSFTEENKTKRPPSLPSLHYPGFVEALQQDLIPKLASFSNRTAILAVLGEGARLHVERVIEEEELVFFDDLLRLMAKYISNESFAALVRGHYRAVLIDEFQDTDPLQWKIFSTLFLTDQFKGPLYVVGDPKQSIYRFRKADLYTYMDAKKEMGERAFASLQTNYRSTPSLVTELNHLFSKPFITLPKTGEILAAPHVLAASELPPLEDGKGALHALIAENEETLFSTIVHEIARLGLPLRSCAVLVSDKHQAGRFIKTCPLPAVSKKSRSLRDSPAFDTVIELVRAAQNPRDRSACARVLAGPLFGYSLDRVPEESDRFYRYHHLLKTEGLLPLFYTVVEEGHITDPILYQDLLHLIEMALSHKEDYLSFYHGLMLLDLESEELRAPATSEEDAIQVMTIHVSKGLEFPVVFPIGVSSPYIQRKALDELSEAEERSEKMRSLYVAFTRAKQRLYIPVLKNNSPLTTFLEGVDLSCFSSEMCQIYPPPLYTPKKRATSFSALLEKSYPPSTIHSYTSLVSYVAEKKEIPEGIIPVGAETGTLIHRLFERISFKEDPLPFVTRELKGTFLEPWTKEVAKMIEKTLHLPLPFSLRDIDPQKMIREMEFLYPSTEPSGFFKGFIDLFFEHERGYYGIDWKTNYIDTSIEEEFQAHQYGVQAAIYKKAIESYLSLFPDVPPFKGMFYIFLRTQEVYFVGE